jgi:hypothetical protein
MPFSWTAFPTSRTTVGELVVTSNHVLPGRIDSRSPPLPRPTSRISFGPGSDVNTTSAARATSATESAHVAPASRCGCALSLRMS